jgi:hypothetical protein
MVSLYIAIGLINRLTIYFKKAIFLMAFLFIAKAKGQTPGLGTWSVVSSKYTFGIHWNVFFETQLRSQSFYNNFHYHEYKGGVGYNFQKRISAILAMGHYVTYQPDGNFKSPQLGNEFRIWEQFVLNNNINRLKIEHRYRIEQRFTKDGYRNRFRYRLNALYPINNLVIKEKTWYLSFNNEIFLNNNGMIFEQNRMYGGIGYQMNKQFTLQAGFMNRWDNFGQGKQQSKNFFQTVLLFSLNEFKSGRELHPSSID